MGDVVTIQIATGCTTEITDKQSKTVSQSVYQINQASINYYRGIIFTFTSNHTVCKLDTKLTKSGGTIVGKTYTLRIWDMSGNNLNNQLAISSGITGDDSWNQTLVTFTLISPVALTGGVQYAATLSTDVTFDGTNYATWCDSNTDVVSNWGYGRWGSDKVQTSSGVQDFYGVFYE